MTKYEKDLPRFRRNLARVYARRIEIDVLSGMLWYESAREYCARMAADYGYSVGTAAVVTAAISPQCRWERNREVADDVLARRPISAGGGGFLRANVRKAESLRDRQSTDTRDAFKDGPKVWNFARNLAGDCHAVTVDTHAAQACYDDVRVSVYLKSGPYDVFARAYRDAAAKVGLAPCDFQAVIWHVWKRENPHKQSTRAQWIAIGEC